MGLFDLFSNDDAEQAAAQRKAGLQQGYDTLSSSYGLGRDALNSGYGAATNLYNPLITSTTAGANAYGDASGANGAAGNTRAVQNFQQGPGFNFALDTGLQALNRTHAAAGNLSSGNTDIDALKYGTGLANQGWTTYLNGLAPYLGANSNAVAGGANAAVGQGTALNQSYQGQGAAGNANYTGQGAADAAATMNNYNVGANQLGAILGAGKLAAGAFGAGGFNLGPTSVGGAPVSGGLFSMFS